MFNDFVNSFDLATCLMHKGQKTTLYAKFCTKFAVTVIIKLPTIVRDDSLQNAKPTYH